MVKESILRCAVLLSIDDDALSRLLTLILLSINVDTTLAIRAYLPRNRSADLAPHSVQNLS